MEMIKGLISIWVVASLFSASNVVEGRYHYHKKPKKGGHGGGGGGRSKSPVSPPPKSHVPSPPALSPPSIPLVPSPVPGGSGTDRIFKVTSFGAVGDGTTNDLKAFQAAWKAACAVESGTILAPSGYSFMITSTIFSGPCKPGLVFKVRISNSSRQRNLHVYCQFCKCDFKVAHSSKSHFPREDGWFSLHTPLLYLFLSNSLNH